MKLMTVKEASSQIRVSKAVVYQACQSGVLQHYRFSAKGKRGRVMIDESDLMAYIEQSRQVPKSPGVMPELKHITL